jgi:hypothetical protein
MNSLEIITEILSESNLSVEQNIIIERDRDNRGREFVVRYEIIKPPEINYKLYRFESRDFPFFSDVPNLKKMCDFILFAEDRNHLHIFLIELKLSNMSAKKQLEAAEEFAKFIIHSSKRIGRAINAHSIKKIRVCNSNLKKSKFMSVEKKYEFDEDNYLDYSLKSFHLKHLVS